MDQASIEREALGLPPEQRALLADSLLASLDGERERKIEAEWVKVAEERLASARRAEEFMRDGPTVLAELRARYQA